MENEVNKGKCFKCIHFDKYYIRGTKNFKACKIGWCSLFKEHKSLQDNCFFYVLKKRRPIYQSSILLALNNILTDLEQIEDVIKEEIRDHLEIANE